MKPKPVYTRPALTGLVVCGIAWDLRSWSISIFDSSSSIFLSSFNIVTIVHVSTVGVTRIPTRVAGNTAGWSNPNATIVTITVTVVMSRGPVAMPTMPAEGASSIRSINSEQRDDGSQYHETHQLLGHLKNSLVSNT
jgi:hypothetical protein